METVCGVRSRRATGCRWLSAVCCLALVLTVGGCADSGSSDGRGSPSAKPARPLGLSTSAVGGRQQAKQQRPAESTASAQQTAASPSPVGSAVRAAGQPASAVSATSGRSSAAECPLPLEELLRPLRGRPKFRPSDTRPVHDDARLAKLGIRKLESKRLRLYTDLDVAAVRQLPALVDQLYDALEAYFGPLPPNPEGTDFQMTGYLMKDVELFRRAGLIPSDLPPVERGRHRGAEFWVRDQKYDYYRRHLVLHEATHCFMTAVPQTEGPLWYMEGMAELFATHELGPDGRARFRIMPRRKEDVPGWGRVTLVQQDVQQHGVRSAEAVTRTPASGEGDTTDYAWWWALCKFLDAHPRYREPFHQLARHLGEDAFDKLFLKYFASSMTDIWSEWPLFARGIEYGYDFERAAVKFGTGRPLQGPDEVRHVRVAADRGWQCSGVLVRQGKKYRVTATGRFVLAAEPKPWVAEPNGVSIRYCRGRPLGVLLAAVRREPPVSDPARQSMLHDFVVGTGTVFEAPVTGTLYFRVNDYWSELADNSGEVEVTVRQARPSVSVAGGGERPHARSSAAPAEH